VLSLREAKAVLFRQRSPGRGILGVQFVQANWHVLTIGVTAGAILCAAVLLFNTMPPREIAMATGPESGGYPKLGRQYQTALEGTGERLRLVGTSGSMENLALLRDPSSGVKVAFIQDGTISKEEQPDLESLGTLFYEPVWIFRRRDIRGLTPTALHGRKVSVGPAGSGARALLLELFKRNGLDQELGELLALESEAAADKLLAADIDVAAFVAEWDGPQETVGWAKARSLVLLQCVTSRARLCPPLYCSTRRRRFTKTALSPARVSSAGRGSVFRSRVRRHWRGRLRSGRATPRPRQGTAPTADQAARPRW
jgi:hypothetical protein